MFGTHRALKPKLISHFGIPIETYEVTNRTLGMPESNLFDEIFDDMTEYARITNEQLAMPFPLY